MQVNKMLTSADFKHVPLRDIDIIRERRRIDLNYKFYTIKKLKRKQLLFSNR